MTCSLVWGYDLFCCCFVRMEVFFTGAAGYLVATSFFLLGEASNGLGEAFLDLKL
jgi:hypothetical protein